MTNGINTEEKMNSFDLIRNFSGTFDRSGDDKKLIKGLTHLHNLQRDNFEKFVNDPETKNLEGIVDPQEELGFMAYGLLFRNLETIKDTETITICGESMEVADNKSDLITSLPNTLALYATLKSLNPDRILTITKSAVPYATLTEFLGYKTDFISAHKHTIDKFEKGIPVYTEINAVKEFESTKKLSNNDKILIIDEHSDIEERTTYGLVKDHLINEKNITPENISVYLGQEKCFNLMNQTKKTPEAKMLTHLNRIKKDNIFIINQTNILEYISTEKLFEAYLETPMIKEIERLGETGIITLHKELYEIITKLT